MPSRRWLIPSSERAVGPADQTYWEDAHATGSYESVYSVSEDAGFRRRLIQVLDRLRVDGRILLSGCGSRTLVQQDILGELPPTVSVVASDYPAVVQLARRAFDHPRLSYVPLGQEFGDDEPFDAVVAVNVLVSADDAYNRDIVDGWARCLRPGGVLVTLTPIIFAGLDLALLTERSDLWQCLDLESSSWTERYQGIRQVEYSPLRLRRVLHEAGLDLEELQIVFLEDQMSQEQARLHYGLDDHDLPIYEQLAVARARKP
jgi:SAM-dependent methyltransferase